MKGKNKILGTAIGVGLFLSPLNSGHESEKIALAAGEKVQEYSPTMPNNTATVPLARSATPKKAIPKPTATTSTLPQPEVIELQNTLDQTLKPALANESIQTLAITPNAQPQTASMVIATEDNLACAGLFAVSRSSNDPNKITASFTLYGPPDILVDPDKINRSHWNDTGHVEDGDLSLGPPPDFLPDDQESISQTISYMGSTLVNYCAHLPDLQRLQRKMQETQSNNG